MPNSASPMKKNMIANRVNKPSASEPRMRRRPSRTIISAAESRDTAMPTMEKSCNGTTEKPVIKSKFRRIRLYKEYFDSPACRSSWAIGTSMGFIA